MANMALHGLVTLLAVLVMVGSLTPSTGIRVLPNHAVTFNATLASSNNNSGKAAVPVLSRRQHYDDGQGTYVGSDNVPSVGADRSQGFEGWKCWSDYFVVHQGIRPGDWRQATGDCYCGSTELCQLQQTDGLQTCKTWSIGVSEGRQSALVNFSGSVADDHQKSLTASGASTCEWHDKQCHCIGARQDFVHQNGYRRDRCNIGNGNVTEGMQDWVHEAPYFIAYNCDCICQHA